MEAETRAKTMGAAAQPKLDSQGVQLQDVQASRQAPAGEETRKKQRRWKAASVAGVALLVLIVGICVGVGLSGVLSGSQAELDSNQGVSDETRADAMNGGRIGYATEGVVATDPETLQQAVDAMYEQAEQPGINLEYKNMAFSENGRDFECYIANSADNVYDMFFAIYADQALTDELFLSELLRPGTRFEKITLERTLEQGEHTAYLVQTQVKDETENGALPIQVIQGQIATVITLSVNP